MPDEELDAAPADDVGFASMDPMPIVLKSPSTFDVVPLEPGLTDLKEALESCKKRGLTQEAISICQSFFGDELAL